MLSHRSQSVLGPKSSAAFAELIALPGALVNWVWTNTVQQVSIFFRSKVAFKTPKQSVPAHPLVPLDTSNEYLVAYIWKLRSQATTGKQHIRN